MKLIALNIFDKLKELILCSCYEMRMCMCICITMLSTGYHKQNIYWADWNFFCSVWVWVGNTYCWMDVIFLNCYYSWAIAGLALLNN